MGKKHSNENNEQPNYFSDLKRELSGVRLPATILFFTLFATIALPYFGSKIAQLTSAYSILEPHHECTFINFDHTEKRSHIEKVVAQNLKTFSLISGAEQLGTTLLEEFPNITSIRCSLDRDHTVRLVITGNNAASSDDEPLKDTKPMQVLQQHPLNIIAQPKKQETIIEKQLTATSFTDTFELLLSTTDALFSKPQQLPGTFHAIAQPHNQNELQSINIANNDAMDNKSIVSHTEPSLSCKGKQL